jgi:peptidyl-prolyl isomerase E (cyclophilin E)
MSKKKTMIYVGGLTSQVNEETLHAAFIPFGEIRSVQIPKDFTESEFSILTWLAFTNTIRYVA